MSRPWHIFHYARQLSRCRYRPRSDAQRPPKRLLASANSWQPTSNNQVKSIQAFRATLRARRIDSSIFRVDHSRLCAALAAGASRFKTSSRSCKCEQFDGCYQPAVPRTPQTGNPDLRAHRDLLRISGLRRSASNTAGTFDPAKFHIFYDPDRLYEAIAVAVAFALVSSLFVFARFSFGYFVGFYFYTMILGYLWLN